MVYIWICGNIYEISNSTYHTGNINFDTYCVSNYVYVKRIKDKTHLSIVIISLLTLAMGLPLSAIATWLSMTGLNYSNTNHETVDATGALTFLMFGIGLNLIMTPLIGMIGGFIQYKKREKKHLS